MVDFMAIPHNLSADAVSEKCKLLSKRKLCIAATAAVLKPSGGNCMVLP